MSAYVGRLPYRAQVGLCGMALAGILAAGCNQPGAKKAEAPAPPPRVTVLSSARFEATVFEVHLPAARAGDLDAKALAARAAAAADLEKALAELGQTRRLYQVDQSVNVAKDTVMIGTREPFVTSTRLTENGRQINTIQYQEVGAIFNLAGGSARDPAGRSPDIRVSVEIAAMTNSPVPISAGGVKAVTVRKVTLTHDGPVHVGQPLVLLGVDSSSPDENGNPLAYVCRIVFSDVVPK